MGTGADRGRVGRARPQLRPVVVAVAGATVVAALAGTRRRRRRATAMSPEDSLAGPALGTAAPVTDSADALATPPLDDAPTPLAANAEPLSAHAESHPGHTGPLPAHTGPLSSQTEPHPDHDAPLLTHTEPHPDHDAPLLTHTEPVRGDTEPLAARTGGVAGEPAAATSWARPSAAFPPVASPPAEIDSDRTDSDGDARPPRRRRSTRAIVGVVVALALVLGAGAMVAAGGADDDGGRDTATGARPTTTTTQPTTTTAPPVAASDAFGLAAQRLTGAGSFTYTGTASATDVSHARPMLWLAVGATIEGQVATSTGRLHEVAVADDGGAAETVTDGSAVWGRRAPSVDALADEPYEAIPGLSDDELPAKGAALLPAWLSAAAAPTETEPDELGRRTFQATIPADALGEIERERRPVDATVVLTLDSAGDPVRVEITSSPDGPAFHLVFEIAGLGSPVAIEPPALTD
jgi:hypothetical protein